MTAKKRSFVMYNDYLHHFEMLSKDEQAELIMVILRYVNGTEPDTASLSAGVRMAFSFIRLRLDEDFEKYLEISKKRSEAAVRSNSRKREQMQTNECKCAQTYANVPDNDNVVVNDNVNENENENENDSESVVVNVVVDDNEAQPSETACRRNEKTTTAGNNNNDFSAPSLGEIKRYCAESNSIIDPGKFYDYYSANGWNVGKNPMKDWKAAIRVWESRERASPASPVKLSEPSYDISAAERRTLAKYSCL